MTIDVPRYIAARLSAFHILAAILTIPMTMAGCADQAGVAAPRDLSPLVNVDKLDPGHDIRVAHSTMFNAGVADSPNKTLNGDEAAVAWPQAQWWRIYADPQLNSLIQTGIAGSPTQATAAARLRESLALAGEAHALTLPSVDATASLTRRHWPESGYYNGGFGGQNTFDNTAGLHFAYALDLFGAERNTEQQALDAAHAAAADARAAQLNLENSIVRTYVQWSLQYALFDIQHRTLSDQQRVLDLANKRFQAGIGTQLEISEAQAPLPQTQLAMEQTQADLALSRHQLAALIGEAPGYGDGLTRPTLGFDIPVTLPSALPADLIGRRPDVAATRWRVEAQSHAIKVAKAAFYPNVNILATGGGQAVGAIFSAFTRLSSMALSVGPAISLPIFEGGRLRSQLGATAARYDAAVAQYNGAIVNALREIADEASTLRSLQRQQTQAAISVSTAQRSYDIAVSGFKRGLTDYLNVLSAEDRLLHEQQAVQQVQAARYAAYANLMAALGGGLQNPENVK